MLELSVWVGPVHSGKSTQALIRAERLRRLGYDVVLLRPRKSIRPSDPNGFKGDRPGMLVTKTGHKYPSLEVDSVSIIPSAAEGSSVLWIDEPFMLEDHESLFGCIQEQRRERRVLISTLGATNKLECISPAVAQLIAVADEIVHCKSDCDGCSKIGAATRSIYVGSEPKTELVKVGGAAQYKALCPACWNEV